RDGAVDRKLRLLGGGCGRHGQSPRRNGIPGHGRHQAGARPAGDATADPGRATVMTTPPVFDAELTAHLKGVVDQLGLTAGPADAVKSVPTSKIRKRAYDRDVRAGNSKLSLVADETGILRWVYQPAASGPSSRRARYGMARRFVGAKAVHEIDIKDTPP